MDPPIVPGMSAMRDLRQTYDEWRTQLDRELDVDVLDDEGRRRCASEGQLTRLISRQQAERYYACNSFVRRRTRAASTL